MSDWVLGYHQVLQFRLLSIAEHVGIFAVCSALGYGLRICARAPVRHPLPGIPVCQRPTP
jgi:hypothetical protein